MQPYRLGGIEISRVVETEDPFLPLLEIFPEARPEDVEANRHWLEPRALTPEGVIIIPVQSYIVRTSRHLIVIDTCVGNHKSYDGMPGWKDRRQTTWMDNLRASGMAPEEVDYVFCSHLH
ncbi:MAG: MBL fold metallo-hydrolase, partial [Alphaproteobacteria bacterium]|nr:MBL fold metallo-hydrolase [Alphaproteobacteria bacterium]